LVTYTCGFFLIIIKIILKKIYFKEIYLSSISLFKNERQVKGLGTKDVKRLDYLYRETLPFESQKFIKRLLEIK